MRISISHNKDKQQVIDGVNRGMDQLFKGFATGPVEFVDQRKHWSGDTMHFSLTAKMGFIRTPIVGTVVVAEKELVVDVDLGLLGKFISEESAKTQLEGRVKGLLA